MKSLSRLYSRASFRLYPTRAIMPAEGTLSAFVCVTSLLLLLLSSPLQALPVDGLYSHEVAVANQSDAERRRAYREALAAVMLKVTGDSRWLDAPSVQSALRSAESLVQEVSFRTGSRQVMQEMPAGSDADTLAEAPMISVPATFISIRFSSDAIDGLLDAANIPIWDRNRPSILVWLTVQDSSGQRTLLGSDSDHQIVDIIEQFSRERGVPFLFPILDLTDRRNLTPNQAWDLDSEAVGNASARYGADSILSGRLLITPNEDLIGLWKFLFKEDEQTFDGFHRELEPYLHEALDRITARLASHYSIVRNTLQNNETVLLRVDGVRDLATHYSLVTYVRDLSVVRSVQVASLQADSLELRISLSGDRGHFVDFIELDRDLQPVISTLADESGILHYRWTR